MGGFGGFDRVIRVYGGIASRRELLAAGWTETEFWFGLRYGNLDRIRHGWYAAADLPDEARRAWASGGPLACVSALGHYGMLAVSSTDPLHICVRSDGHLPLRASPDVVVHWSTSDFFSGSRRAVSLTVALAQARACSPAAARAAAARAAEVSRSRIHSGTARVSSPSAMSPFTSAASSSPMSHASSSPPEPRAP